MFGSGEELTVGLGLCVGVTAIVGIEFWGHQGVGEGDRGRLC